MPANTQYHLMPPNEIRDSDAVLCVCAACDVGRYADHSSHTCVPECDAGHAPDQNNDCVGECCETGVQTVESFGVWQRAAETHPMLTTWRMRVSKSAEKAPCPPPTMTVSVR